MNLSGSVIRIVILSLPGIISALLYWRLRGKVGRKDWEDFLEIGVFSLGVYVVYSLGIILLNYLILTPFFGFLILPPKALNALTNDSIPIPWDEIREATLVGIVLAVLVAYADKYNLINRIGLKIKASNRVGDKDVWETFFHHREIGWVYVRDHKVNRTYYGWLLRYSETEKPRELILKDVDVYEGATLRYSRSLMYISRDKHDLTIEFIPNAPTTTTNNILKEAQMSDEKPPSPAIKIFDPPPIDNPGEAQKSYENTNRQTPRPTVPPEAQPATAAPAPAAAPAAAAPAAAPATAPAAAAAPATEGGKG